MPIISNLISSQPTEYYVNKTPRHSSHQNIPRKIGTDNERVSNDYDRYYINNDSTHPKRSFSKYNTNNNLSGYNEYPSWNIKANPRANQYSIMSESYPGPNEYNTSHIFQNKEPNNAYPINKRHSIYGNFPTSYNSKTDGMPSTTHSALRNINSKIDAYLASTDPSRGDYESSPHPPFPKSPSRIRPKYSIPSNYYYYRTVKDKGSPYSSDNNNSLFAQYNKYEKDPYKRWNSSFSKETAPKYSSQLNLSNLQNDNNRFDDSSNYKYYKECDKGDRPYSSLPIQRARSLFPTDNHYSARIERTERSGVSPYETRTYKNGPEARKRSAYINSCIPEDFNEDDEALKDNLIVKDTKKLSNQELIATIRKIYPKGSFDHTQNKDIIETNEFNNEKNQKILGKRDFSATDTTRNRSDRTEKIFDKFNLSDGSIEKISNSNYDIVYSHPKISITKEKNDDFDGSSEKKYQDYSYPKTSITKEKQDDLDAFKPYLPRVTHKDDILLDYKPEKYRNSLIDKNDESILINGYDEKSGLTPIANRLNFENSILDIPRRTKKKLFDVDNKDSTINLIPAISDCTQITYIPKHSSNYDNVVDIKLIDPVIAKNELLKTNSYITKDKLGGGYKNEEIDINNLKIDNITPTPPSTYRSRRERIKNEQASETVQTGLRGLANLGNTCFMNSIIQVLSNTKPLLKYMQNESYINDINPKSPHHGEIIKEFAQLLKEIWGSEYIDNKFSIRPVNLKKKVELYAPRFSGYNQQDSQEFLVYLLNGFHDDLNQAIQKTASSKRMSIESATELSAEVSWKKYQETNKSKIVDIFGGQLKGILICDVCANKSLAYDPFWNLSLSIANDVTTPNIFDCLNNLIKEEKLTADNAPFCAKCGKRESATKSFKIQRFPQILIIHLKRFAAQSRNGIESFIKIRTAVEFPFKGLDLKDFSNTSNRSYDVCLNEASNYDLYAITCHTGSISCGHYFSYCKHPTDRKWHLFEDSKVEEVSESNIDTNNAYLLFYQKRED